ncbi:hypothetical protein ACFOFO_08910 [Undibacterium arcticum]|uniref:Uncharacterized protein n=2 Tax=Undibacterium arcticum TaxID=1762892 RepID=A0ABV7EZ96_9BURK
MSALIESHDVVSHANPGSLAVEIREGDWIAYHRHIDQAPSERDLIHRFGGVIEYHRACAMAYLGRRAQHRGGVCSRTHPRILTPQFVADLEATNKYHRYIRYPWLETLLNLLTEIERIQDEISSGGSSNVISLIPTIK